MHSDMEIGSNLLIWLGYVWVSCNPTVSLENVFCLCTRRCGHIQGKKRYRHRKNCLQMGSTWHHQTLIVGPRTRSPHSFQRHQPCGHLHFQLWVFRTVRQYTWPLCCSCRLVCGTSPWGPLGVTTQLSVRNVGITAFYFSLNHPLCADTLSDPLSYCSYS